jgi:glycine hydroxymethyltransferase
MSELERIDPQIYEAVQREEERQTYKLQLIASENVASPAVREAQASLMTNKYAEGYPGRRYYGGCEWVDVAETLARERAQKLFGSGYVNVQPHSGTQANMAVYFAVLKPGDTICGMNLSHGGHLSHGSPVNFTGKMYKVVSYGVRRDTEMIDYEELEAIAKEHRPKLIIAGASAYPRVIDFAIFQRIAKSVGAYLVADMAHIAGLIAAGVHPSPVPWADFVTSTTHKTLRGPRGGFILARQEYAKLLNREVFPGIQGGPLMHVIASKAVAFQEALQPQFRAYANQIILNARRLAEVLREGGFRIVSGGTDNHLMLVDLTPRGLTGKEAEAALDAAGITVNKNGIPFDEKPPTITSGIRIGTPALTTRGMKEREMEIVGRFIRRVLERPTDEAQMAKIREEVREFCSGYPLFTY